jgi:hypothetical protein
MAKICTYSGSPALRSALTSDLPAFFSNFSSEKLGFIPCFDFNYLPFEPSIE